MIDRSEVSTETIARHAATSIATTGPSATSIATIDLSEVSTETIVHHAETTATTDHLAETRVAMIAHHVATMKADLHDAHTAAAVDSDPAAVAVDPAADAAILRVQAHNLQALALSTDAQVGDSVFCLSEPGGHGPPYFSAGIVNRFLTTDAHTDQKQLQPNAPKVPRINVSTDWAPGSSGSAVLDARGNAIGHVGSISAIAAPAKGSDKPAHHMNLHWAVPAGSVLDLAKQGAPQKNGGTDTQQTGTRE
jgi:S1-C subfamily serine protease